MKTAREWADKYTCSCWECRRRLVEEAQRDALEAAAKVADKEADSEYRISPDDFGARARLANRIGAAIRALVGKDGNG